MSAPRLDRNRGIALVHGDTKAKFHQAKVYFTLLGTPLTDEQFRLTGDEFEAKFPDFKDNGNPIGAVAAGGAAPAQMVGLDDFEPNATPDEPPPPVVTRESLRAELAEMRPIQIKKLIEQTKGLNPFKGKDSTVKNVKLLLTDRFGPELEV